MAQRPDQLFGRTGTSVARRRQIESSESDFDSAAGIAQATMMAAPTAKMVTTSKR